MIVALGALAAAAALLPLAPAAGPAAAHAALVVPEEPAPPAASAVLRRIEAAFLAGDHAGLADLVHPDGVRVALAPQPERTSELTAAQAHYYFKNLFQSRRTVRFDYLRDGATADGRVHAVAVWRHAQTDSGEVTARRLLFTLASDPSGWRLTEIMTLRGG